MPKPVVRIPNQEEILIPMFILESPDFFDNVLKDFWDPVENKGNSDFQTNNIFMDEMEKAGKAIYQYGLEKGGEPKFTSQSAPERSKLPMIIIFAVIAFAIYYFCK